MPGVFLHTGIFPVQLWPRKQNIYQIYSGFPTKDAILYYFETNMKIRNMNEMNEI